MNRTPTVKIELCDQCRWDSGWHYDDPDHPTRPHHDAAKVKEQAQRIVELAHEEQTKLAREIVKSAAETMLEFSANQIRHIAEEQGIEGAVFAAAFGWASEPHEDQPALIEPTGRGVMSTDPRTRHRINIWRSKVHRLSDRYPLGAVV